MEILISLFIQPFVDMVDDPILFLQVIWEGFVTGILYSLIAFGFVLIFKASGVFNFAQGIMVVFAALTLVGLHESGIPAYFALPITILVMYALAFSVEKFVLSQAWSKNIGAKCNLFLLHSFDPYKVQNEERF